MRTLKRSIKIFALIFFVTCAARTAYELVFTGKDIVVTYPQNNYADYEVEYDTKESFRSKSNIASERLNQVDLDGKNVLIDQKYEKTANITATTDKFSEDNKNLRKIIEDNNAVIQVENMQGLSGNQTVDMVIGVMPDNFDIFVEQIQSIGKIESFHVNKVDKTTEYRELMAQMETMQKSIDSYNEMKQRGGDIKDLLLLEDKILDTHQKIQQLGVNLGNFNTENSFCTINFSMKEVRVSVVDEDISVRFVLKCVKNAFFWSIGLYVLLFVVAIGSLFAIWMLLIMYANLKRQWVVSKDDKSDNASDDEK